VRTARGAKKRRDGEKKALKRGAARFPVLVFALGTPISRLADCVTPFRRMAFPGKKCGLGWSSVVFAVPALQNFLFSVFVFVFLFAL
jgi:hypothetical protein